MRGSIDSGGVCKGSGVVAVECGGDAVAGNQGGLLFLPSRSVGFCCTRVPLEKGYCGWGNGVGECVFLLSRSLRIVPVCKDGPVALISWACCSGLGLSPRVTL